MRVIRHALSFLGSPLGYVLNMLATLAVYAEMHAPVLAWPLVALAESRWFNAACFAHCARDGIQDDPLF